mmetsp:Transcript_10217/g.18066  ORF Transcript_10217/g.18066 Transcript_10217/m.18066 type:complete len:219 (+) Transcript_10217:809-1465(+)
MQLVHQLFVPCKCQKALPAMVHPMLQLIFHPYEQEHVTIIWALHLLVQLKPELASFEDKLTIQVFRKWRFAVSMSLNNSSPIQFAHILCIFVFSTKFYRVSILLELFRNVVQNDTLPIAIGSISLPLYILQSFQVTQIDTIEPVLHIGTPSVAFGFDHVSKFEFCHRTNRSKVLIKSIQKRNARWNRHTLNVFVADSINILYKGSNRISMRHHQTFVT